MTDFWCSELGFFLTINLLVMLVDFLTGNLLVMLVVCTLTFSGMGRSLIWILEEIISLYLWSRISMFLLIDASNCGFYFTKILNTCTGTSMTALSVLMHWTLYYRSVSLYSSISPKYSPFSSIIKGWNLFKC